MDREGIVFGPGLRGIVGERYDLDRVSATGQRSGDPRNVAGWPADIRRENAGRDDDSHPAAPSAPERRRSEAIDTLRERHIHMRLLAVPSHALGRTNGTASRATRQRTSLMAPARPT